MLLELQLLIWKLMNFVFKKIFWILTKLETWRFVISANNGEIRCLLEQYQDSFDVSIDTTQFIPFLFREHIEMSDKLLFGLLTTEATGIPNSSPHVSSEN